MLCGYPRASSDATGACFDPRTATTLAGECEHMHSFWAPRPREEVIVLDMQEVMYPELVRLNQALEQGRNTHIICAERLTAARQGMVPIASIPTVPVIFDRADRYFKHLLIAQLTLNKLEQWVEPERAAGPTVAFTVNPAYVPPPIVMGILWGKPYVNLYPLPGITPDNWGHLYPRFHYSGTNICIGEQFKIGEQTDPQAELPKLVELLSWVNLTNSYIPLSGAAALGGVWPHWAGALTKALKGQKQGVLVPIKRLSV